MSAILKNLTDADLPEKTASGRVLKILHDEPRKLLSVNLELDELVPMTELLSAADTLSAELGAEVTLYPKYHQSLFNGDYIFDIIELLKRKIMGVNGYFEGAELSNDDNTYEITLSSGGKGLLSGLGIEKKIESYVKGFFGVNITVTLSSDNELDVDEYVNKEQSAPVEQITVAPAPPPKSSGWNGGGNGGGGYGRSRRPQFLDEPTEIALGFENEHFGGTASLFYGKGNFDPPAPMSEPFGDQDEATVWGTVFKTEEKVSRDGKTLIFTAYFSDKTSSHIIKIITGVENTEAVKKNIASENRCWSRANSSSTASPRHSIYVRAPLPPFRSRRARIKPSKSA